MGAPQRRWNKCCPLGKARGVIWQAPAAENEHAAALVLGGEGAKDYLNLWKELGVVGDKLKPSQYDQGVYDRRTDVIGVRPFKRKLCHATVHNDLFGRGASLNRSRSITISKHVTIC